jgi:Winged helix DNA-binding domain
MYVGLWSRLPGFRRAALTRALERHEVLQGTLMRITIHLVSPRDHRAFAVATREARRRTWLRARPDLTAAAMDEAARVVAGALAERPHSRQEVEALVGKEPARGIHAWLDLLREPPSGTWERRRADLYALAPPAEMDAGAALDHTVAAYLRAFGPATRKDVASWLGTPVGEIGPSVDRLDLVAFRGPEGETLLDVPDGVRPDPATPAPPRFLPVWEALLLVHARRTQVLPEAHRPRVFSTKKPHGTPTFLVDGAVAGEWRHEDGHIALTPYAPLEARDRRALEAEAERLAAFHAD